MRKEYTSREAIVQAVEVLVKFPNSEQPIVNIKLKGINSEMLSETQAKIIGIYRYPDTVKVRVFLFEPYKKSILVDTSNIERLVVHLPEVEGQNDGI